jgi:hypothetical protein
LAIRVTTLSAVVSAVDASLGAGLGSGSEPAGAATGVGVRGAAIARVEGGAAQASSMDDAKVHSSRRAERDA